MIKENLLAIISELPKNVALVAVSKTKPVADLMQAYEAGQRIFGENKIQEMCDKQLIMPADVEWHMIGHVQSNKVKYMVPFVDLIHGVDSLKLLEEINKQSLKNNRVTNCLLQIHIAEEDTKFGLDEKELFDILSSTDFQQLNNICIKGLMGMATFTDDQAQIRKEFTMLKTIFDKVKALEENPNLKPDVLSMGMSADYKIAIECGSTMIRVGSSIFGGRH